MDVTLVARDHKPEVFLPDRDLDAGLSTELVLQDRHRGNELTDHANKHRIIRLIDPAPLSALLNISAIFIGDRRFERIQPWRIFNTKPLTVRRSLKKNYGTIVEVEFERTIAWVNPSPMLE
ncbi:hypothetical protein [Sorangium sp. So ce1389]|uniref:hypothetical protein n=1 Tax=Sorangium sp. So ce1389 TaxID=3133336 RepID=UPI003F61C97A